MKRVFLHSKKVIANHWFIILIAWAISFILGIGMFLVFLIFSLAFSEDPVDVNEVLNVFTEEELEIILSETVDESVSDEEYLKLLARYQSYFCPKKVDKLTIWEGSESTKDSFILFYKIKKEIEGFDTGVLKENILKIINPNSVQAIRLARSNKNMIFRYTYSTTGESFDIIISNQELMAA